MARSYLCRSVFTLAIVFCIESFGEGTPAALRTYVRQSPVSDTAKGKKKEVQTQSGQVDEAIVAQVEQEKTQNIQNQLITDEWNGRPVKLINFTEKTTLTPPPRKLSKSVYSPKPAPAETETSLNKDEVQYDKLKAQNDCKAQGKVWIESEVFVAGGTCSEPTKADSPREEPAAPVVANPASNAECEAKLSEAIYICNEETDSAVDRCNIVKNESVQMGNQFKNNMQGLLYQSQGQIESLGSMSTAMNGLSVAMSGLQGRCAMAKSSCSNACSAAQSIIEKCRSSLSGTLGGGNNNAASVEVSIASSITECEGLDEIVSDLENSIASVLASGQKMQEQACDIAANKNNPICSGLAFNPNTGIDCFSNPSHSSCLPPTSGGVGNLKVNPLSALPSSSTTSRGAGVTGGSLSGGDGGNYNGFNIGDSENSLNDKVFAAKPLKGGSGGPSGGGGGFGGGGSPGGGGSSGGSPGAGATGGGMASDLEMGFGKLSGDDSIAARKLGMGNSRSGPAPLERDRNGNIIYPSRDLKFNMNRFRPNFGGGRGVAGSLTIGPDGITGSNSDLWKKINIQYGYQQDTLD